MRRAEKASERESGGRRLNRQLSDLQEFIVLRALEGIERGVIAEEYFGLERRYKGFWTDPCFSLREKQAYEQRYRRAQPAISRALRTLEACGLVELLRHRRYVKKVRATAQGKKVAEALSADEREQTPGRSSACRRTEK